MFTSRLAPALALALTVAVVAAPAATGAPAPTAAAAHSAAASNFIYGHVEGPEGDLWPDVEVTAVNQDTGIEVAHEVTDDGGYYDFYLGEGQFVVSYHDPAGRTPDRTYGSVVDTAAFSGTTFCLGHVTMTYGDLVNTAVPTITGSSRVGQTITAAPGTWSVAEGTTYQYIWLVDGHQSGYGPTKDLQPYDAGSKVRVEVIAWNQAWNEAHAFSTTLTIGKAQSHISATAPAKVRRNRPVPIAAHVVDPTYTVPWGIVSVLENGRVLAQAHTTNRADGLVKVPVYGLRVGRHTLTVRWPGTDAALPSSTRVTVTITR